MPGANCAFPGCNVSRYKLHKGTTIFSIKEKKRVLSAMEKRKFGSFVKVSRY